MYYMKIRDIVCGFIVRRGRKTAEIGSIILM